MPEHTDPTIQHIQSKKLIDAATRLAAVTPWLDLQLRDIATEADVPLADTYRLFPSKQAILDAAMQDIDIAMLATPTDAADSPKDRLFEALMNRFEALQDYRQPLVFAAKRLRRGRADAILMLAPAAIRLGHSMRWALEAAGQKTSGLRGSLRLHLVTAAYLSVLKVWIDDASPDLTATMAALDRALGRIENHLASGSPSSSKAATMFETVADAT